MDAFLIHCFSLTWISLAIARKLTSSISSQILTTAVVAWGNIVITSLVLSGLGALGSALWYFSVSLLISGLSYLLCSRISAESERVPLPRDDRAHPWLIVLFVVCIAPLAGVNVISAFIYLPNSNEALTMGFPRALYYIGQQSLNHFDSADLRQLYLPFNYNLLQVFGFIYAPSIKCQICLT